MKQFGLSALALCLAASIGLTHSGVQNPAVMARMDGMSEIGAAMKVIGEMAKGARDFDAGAAQRAAKAIAAQSKATPDLFRAPEDDPKSEARPVIWENFDDFTKLAITLETVANEVAQSITAEGDLPEALQRLGDACKACHKTYRE